MATHMTNPFSGRKLCNVRGGKDFSSDVALFLKENAKVTPGAVRTNSTDWCAQCRKAHRKLVG